jgi:hypothetical protein
VSAFAIVVTKNVLKKSFLMFIKDLIGKLNIAEKHPSFMYIDRQARIFVCEKLS